MPFSLTIPLALAVLGGTANAAQSCLPLTVTTSSHLSDTADYFASWNIDSSRDRLFFDIDWTDPTIVYLASQIGNSRIRFGGTGNDYLYYGFGSAPPCNATVPGNKYECLNSTWFDALSAISTASSNPLVFGVNIHPAQATSPPKGPWDPKNAISMLQYAKAHSAPIFALELGNEQNTIMTAVEQADAFRALSSAVDTVYGSGSDRPFLVGPDPHSFRDTGSALPQLLKYINDFLVSAGPTLLKAVTHHEYIEITSDNVVDPTFLDTTANIARSIMKVVRGVNPTIEVWAGEIGPHNGGTVGPGVYPNCSGNKACGKFASALWYADSMGSKATAGYSAYCRQDVLGADYGLLNYTTHEPSPDYWLLVAWKALVGTRVLEIAPPTPSTTRSYAFCTLGNPNSITLVLINLDAATSVCYTPPSGAVAGSNFTQWAFTPGSSGVVGTDTYLNSVKLTFDGSKLPPLPGMSSPVSSGITLPPLSVNLITIPMQGVSSGVCSGA